MLSDTNKVVSSAFINKTSIIDMSLRSLSSTVCNVGPIPEPWAMLLLIAFGCDNAAVFNNTFTIIYERYNPVDGNESLGNFATIFA
jgi:hypothetical protein